MKFKTTAEWAEYFKGHEINAGMLIMVMQEATDEVSAKYEKRIAEIYAQHEKQKEMWYAAIDRRDKDIDRMCGDIERKDE